MVWQQRMMLLHLGKKDFNNTCLPKLQYCFLCMFLALHLLADMSFLYSRLYQGKIGERNYWHYCLTPSKSSKKQKERHTSIYSCVLRLILCGVSAKKSCWNSYSLPKRNHFWAGDSLQHMTDENGNHHHPARLAGKHTRWKNKVCVRHIPVLWWFSATILTLQSWEY